jgi:hypothetical protein
MVEITTLPGTIEIRKEDTISFYIEMFKDSGYSEEDITRIVESYYNRTSLKSSYREILDDKKWKNKSETKYNGRKVLFMREKFELARERFKPESIKYLLVAEAPPAKDSNRFFYYLNIDKGDSLFLETMKVLYPANYDTRTVRNKKATYLERFKADGFYLIDATDTPMPNYSRAQKRKQLQNSLPELLEKIRLLSNNDTKIILIAAPVYEVCKDPLMKEGFNIVNLEMIDFPGSGGQVKYRSKMMKLLGFLDKGND